MRSFPRYERYEELKGLVLRWFCQVEPGMASGDRLAVVKRELRRGGGGGSKGKKGRGTIGYGRGTIVLKG